MALFYFGRIESPAILGSETTNQSNTLFQRTLTEGLSDLSEPEPDLDLTKYLAQLDANGNKIEDQLENKIFNKNTQECHIIIGVNLSTNTQLNIKSQIISKAIKFSHEIPFSQYTLLSGSWNTQDILSFSTNPSMASTILYIKADEEINESMLETMNQVQMNTPQFQTISGNGDPNMRLAILDRGVDPTHIAMTGKNIFWKDFTTQQYVNAQDPVGHGTAVASIAVGNRFNVTDGLGRFVISESHLAGWEGYPWEIGKNYLLLVGSVNVSDYSVKIDFNAKWNKEESSDVVVTELCLMNETGAYVKNVPISKNVETLLDYSLTPDTVGLYKFGYIYQMTTTNGHSTHTFQCDVHVPIAVRNQSEDNPGSPYYTYKEFRGIAPNVQLALLRCAFISDTLAAMQWLVDNAQTYNITVTCISLNFESVEAIVLANQMAAKGITVVVSASNHGAGTNYAGSYKYAPASSDYVITVGAIGRNNSVTSYSSQGGPSYTQRVIKPDLVAPGGELPDRSDDVNSPFIVADNNANEFYYEDPYTGAISSTSERILNDTAFFSGTSFSAPFVAGIALLLLEKLGGMSSFQYKLNTARLIKNILLCSATETAPNPRIDYSHYSPTLERGGKDVHEGYGMINPLAALQLASNIKAGNNSASFPLFAPNATMSNLLNLSRTPYAYAFNFSLSPSYYYNFTIDCGPNLDADIYIYGFANTYGEPYIWAKAVGTSIGASEQIINFHMENDSSVFVLIKGILGSGNVNLTITALLDTEAPYFLNLIHPLTYDFSSTPLIVESYVLDQHTAIRFMQILATSLDKYGNPSLSPNQTLTIVKYNQTMYCALPSISDGWYDVVFRFFDGNNNSIDSSSIRMVLDIQAPDMIKILSPTPETLVYQQFLLQYSVGDTFAGIASVELLYEPTTLILDSHQYSRPVITTELIEGTQNITSRFVVKTDSSMDGRRFFILKVTDHAGNVAYSKMTFFDIENVFMNQYFLYTTLAFCLIALIELNILAKKILLKVDIFEIIQKFKQLPQKMRNRILQPSKKRAGDR